MKAGGGGGQAGGSLVIADRWGHETIAAEGFWEWTTPGPGAVQSNQEIVAAFHLPWHMLLLSTLTFIHGSWSPDRIPRGKQERIGWQPHHPLFLNGQ